MARAYSDDLRERVAAAVAEGGSCRTVAKLFRISPSSVVKWSQRYRQTGSAAAKPMGGVRRAVLANHRAWLLERIKQKPDLTLQAIRSELADHGLTVSLWAVWKFYASEKITFKKRARIGGPPVAVETGRAIVARRGAAESFLVDLSP